MAELEFHRLLAVVVVLDQVQTSFSGQCSSIEKYLQWFFRYFANRQPWSTPTVIAKQNKRYVKSVVSEGLEEWMFVVLGDE